MKPAIQPELQAKFLQYLNNRKKKADEGFTLIELLVVVIIIGVLAAIALPSMLGQVNKAKQSEAKNNVGALNRAQQAYYIEYSEFTSDLTKLGVGFKSQTDNYQYTATISSTGGFLNHKAAAQKPVLKSYHGIIGTQTGTTATSEALTIAFACEADSPGAVVPGDATGFGCLSGYTSLAR